MSQALTILYLYPNEMNIYGDIGNVRTLVKRLEWRGYAPEVLYHHPGQTLIAKPDIVVGGGGQDSGQLKVCDDLQRIQAELRTWSEDDVPMLMICGMYQLFGNRFITRDKGELPGIGVFDMETRATGERLIGPLVLDTPFGEIVGYENHSGQTFLAKSQQSSGAVRRGYGNTSDSKAEGAVTHNVYGSYLYGAVLPKNPGFTDALLKLAIEKRYGPTELKPLDNTVADKARQIAAKR